MTGNSVRTGFHRGVANGESTHVPSDVEDRLPLGQPFIQTSVQEMVYVALNIALRMATYERGWAVIVAVTGPPGVGKTIATEQFLREQHDLSHTGRPPVARVKARPRGTAKRMAEDVCLALGAEPEGMNTYALADHARNAIRRADLRLLIVDEADNLNADSFGVLRSLFDRTGCSVALVGLPRLLNVFKDPQHAQFRDRLTANIALVPMDEVEVVAKVLPNLKIPRWRFNPDDPADRALGSHVWQELSPSFRALRTALEIASVIAPEYKKARIDKQLLDIVLQWMHHIDRTESPADTSAPPPKAGEPPRTKQRQVAETTGQQSLQEGTDANTNLAGAVAAERGDSAEHRSMRAGEGAASPSTAPEQKSGDGWDAQQAAITAGRLVNTMSAEQVAQKIRLDIKGSGVARERPGTVEADMGAEQAEQADANERGGSGEEATK